MNGLQTIRNMGRQKHESISNATKPTVIQTQHDQTIHIDILTFHSLHQ